MKANLTEIDDSFEIGGNYFELIEFSLQRNLSGGRKITGIYGVNVVKVREVVHMPKINPLSSTVPGIAGIFELRGIPIPAINLCTVLGDYNSPMTQDQQIIVTEFSHKRAGFIVNSTNRIRRVTWDKVLPPSADHNSSITGMMLIEQSEFLFILDLEKIISQLEVIASGGAITTGIHYVAPSTSNETMLMSAATRNAPGILLVDDSDLILTNMSKALSKEGFRVITARDGVEAFEKLQNSLQANSRTGPVNVVLTDVEMPKMDGFTFIRKVRSMAKFDQLPIYIHSSLGDNNSKEQGQEAGATGYFVKNDIFAIVETFRDLFLVQNLSPLNNRSA